MTSMKALSEVCIRKQLLSSCLRFAQAETILLFIRHSGSSSFSGTS